MCWTGRCCGVAQRVVLTRVVLRDGERVRVMRLDGTTGTDGKNEPQCVMEVWRGEELLESQVLMRDGKALSFIPFVFHGLKGSVPERSKLPLADIIAANL